MKPKTKILLGLILLGLVDAAIPIPILCLILISVIIRRPSWFMDMVQDIYREEGA